MITTVKAHQKFLRQTPRKLRLVAQSFKNLPLNQALSRLDFIDKRAARLLKPVVIQAQKNAINNAHLQPDSLTVSAITVDAGPIIKRWQPVSRGRAHSILKRTSHLTVTVTGLTQTVKTAAKPATVEPAKTKKVK